MSWQSELSISIFLHNFFDNQKLFRDLDLQYKATESFIKSNLKMKKLMSLISYI